MTKLINLLILVYILLAFKGINAGTEYSDIIVSDPKYDTLGEIIKRPISIVYIDYFTGEKSTLGDIDLIDYGFNDIAYTSKWVYDWKRDKAIISFDHQVIIPDYQILDINKLSLSRLNCDSIRNTEGELHITPDCNYIIIFGNDLLKSNIEDYRQKPEVLYTCVFDAQDYKPISTIRGLSVIGNAIPPDYFIPDGDSIIYIADPITSFSNWRIIRLTLPDLKITDTLDLGKLCLSATYNSFVYAAQANKVLIYVRCINDYSQYELIDIHSKKSLGDIIDSSKYIYRYAKISDDENYIAIHSGDTIVIYDTTLTKLYQIENIGFNALQSAYFKNGLLIIKSNENNILNKYDIATGALLERIQIHEVQH